jgi:two-component system phosphate regulon response regulator PhoB
VLRGGREVGPLKILVVEDDDDILEVVAHALEKAGMRVLKARTGMEAIALVSREKPDLIILDIMLPQMDGKEVCRRIKQSDRTRLIPVVMLTALGEERDRILGFELGADDYVTKPFSPKELVLRVLAILRRRHEPMNAKKTMGVSDIFIDPDGFRVEVEGKEVVLTPTEFRLLCELVQNAGKVLTREVLLDRVWGQSCDVYARTVDTHIKRLRKKMGAARDRIETLRGIGYRFRG